MTIEKGEYKQALIDSINLFEQMIDGNQDKMIELQDQIRALQDNNVSYLAKIRDMNNKLRDIKEV